MYVVDSRWHMMACSTEVLWSYSFRGRGIFQYSVPHVVAFIKDLTQHLAP